MVAVTRDGYSFRGTLLVAADDHVVLTKVLRVDVNPHEEVADVLIRADNLSFFHLVGTDDGDAG